jgi:hypothetical protein
MKELYSIKHNGIVLGLAGVVIISLLLLAMPVSATPPSGLTGEPIASGILPEAVRAKFKTGEGGFTDGTNVNDILLVKYTLEPGGTFGWHQHAGPVWAIITSGTLSIYDGDDSTCTPHFYGAGNALLDEGTHTHLGVNETNEPVEIYATFMLPEGGVTRVDAEDPGICK